MNTKKLTRYLLGHGCLLARHGRGHDIWVGADRRQSTVIPRHRETDAMLTRKICADLHVPPPAEK